MEKRQSNVKPLEFDDGVYYIRVEGDRHRMVDSDIVEVLEGALLVAQSHYNVTLRLLTADKGEPRRVPIKVKLSVRDCYGREAFYTTTWQMVESEPGARGLVVQTGMTNSDLDGVRGEVEVGIGI